MFYLIVNCGGLYGSSGVGAHGIYIYIYIFAISRVSVVNGEYMFAYSGPRFWAE